MREPLLDDILSFASGLIAFSAAIASKMLPWALLEWTMIGTYDSQLIGERAILVWILIFPTMNSISSRKERLVAEAVVVTLEASSTSEMTARCLLEWSMIGTYDGDGLASVDSFFADIVAILALMNLISSIDKINCVDALLALRILVSLAHALACLYRALEAMTSFVMAFWAYHEWPVLGTYDCHLGSVIDIDCLAVVVSVSMHSFRALDEIFCIHINNQ